MTACALVIVADSSRARFFCAGGYRDPWEEVLAFDHAAGRVQKSDLSSDRPGRAFDSVGGGRHAMAARTDPRQHEAEVFAREIVGELSQNKRLSECGRIALVAPPRFLGHLRAHLTPRFRERVACEVGKSLVTQKPEDIRQQLPRGW